MLSLGQVSYRYLQGLAVENVTADFQGGELVAIVGPNGSGKSTLLKLMARVLVPTGGEVRLMGKNQQLWPAKEYARAVGYLPQEIGTSFPIRVFDVVLSGRAPFLGRFEWEGESDIRAAERSLDLCDASHLRDRWVDQMSGGERKRVFLARVLAAEPRLLLLDEPLTGLDVAHVQTFIRLLRSIVDHTGTTALLVSHELNWCSAYCDRMLVMHEGRLVLDSAPSAVMTPAVMKEVFAFESESLSSGRQGTRWIVPRVPETEAVD